jgi:type II secretory pathway pseudopilin PulG
MNRRQGFTITELLVSLALIIFIMLILIEAFGRA